MSNLSYLEFMGKYLFLFCAIYWFIAALIQQRKIGKYIESSQEETNDAELIRKWIIPFFTIPLLLLFAIDFFDGKELFSDSNTLDIYIISSAIITFLFTGYLCYWVILRNGAQIISRIEIFGIKNSNIAKAISIMLFCMTVYGIIQRII